METETERLQYPDEHRDNFEMDIDPKLYVKDKYLYQNRRIRTTIYVLCCLAIMLLILLLSVFFVGYLISYRKNAKEDFESVKSSGTAEKVTSLLTNSVFNDTVSESVPVAIETTSQPIWTTTGDPLIEWKRQFIRRMALEAYDKYERHAWGQDALRPLTKDYSWNLFGLNSGLTIVSSMSTLWVMDMNEQFNSGKVWIRDNLNFSRIIQHINVQHTVTQFIGSLLSTYALTGDDLFLQKAIEIAIVLRPAYESNNKGLPFGKLVPKTEALSDTIPTLSELGGQNLEYTYLADITSDKQYRNRVEKVQEFLRSIEKPNHLYMKRIYIETGEWFTDISTLAKSGGNFYSNLIKSYIQSNLTNENVLNDYKESIDAMERIGMFAISKSGLHYARNFHSGEGKFDDYMNYDSCYLGAMLGQGATVMEKAKNRILNAKVAKSEMERIERHWNLAEQLTDTCYQASVRSPTGLPPHHFYFKDLNDATNTGIKYKEFNLG